MPIQLPTKTISKHFISKDIISDPLDAKYNEWTAANPTMFVASLQYCCTAMTDGSVVYSLFITVYDTKPAAQ